MAQLHTDPQSLSRTPSSAPSASPFPVDIAWQAETITTNKSPLHSCSAPKQILLPTLTVLLQKATTWNYDLLPLQPAETSLRHVTFQTFLTNNSYRTCVFNIFSQDPNIYVILYKLSRPIPRVLSILFLTFSHPLAFAGYWAV